MDVNRREWLSIGTVAAAELLPFPATGKTGANRIRLPLNQNPFGLSPLALRAIRSRLADLRRYISEEEIAALTTTIAQGAHALPSLQKLCGGCAFFRSAGPRLEPGKTGLRQRSRRALDSCDGPILTIRFGRSFMSSRAENTYEASSPEGL